MWARNCELILGVWLILSRFVFLSQDWDGLVTGFFVILFAALSYHDKLNKMHLFQALPAAWLLYVGYTYPTPWLPFYLQNYILVALSILMFAIIPSNASDHPRPWKRFLENESDGK